MNPLKIIEKYYYKNSKAYNILIVHSNLVTKKAIQIANNVPHLNPNLKFIKEAGMLHDIGIILTNAPDIGCYGKKPYISHGYLGKNILEKEGYQKHALVCERHIGVGLTKEDIIKQKLPIPKKNIIPLSIEEEIICFADKFFSKSKHLNEEKSIPEIKKSLSKYGKDKVEQFEKWIKKFNYK